MDAKIHVSRLGGTATVPPSKSAAHRAVLCAALAEGTSHITNIEYSKDIRATLGAAAQLGAKITEEAHSVTIKGHGTAGGFVTVTRPVFCNESGSTLRFIHNCMTMYDHSRGWITHCSLQRIDLYRTAENVEIWRPQYGKPCVLDEIAYEGNLPFGWGNISGEEMTRRFWEAYTRGGYGQHGETYENENGVIWWSHGGELKGSSPARIQFLLDIMEENGGYMEPLPAFFDETCCTNSASHPRKDCVMYYYGANRPCRRPFHMPEGQEFDVEVIDTWNMTITPAGRHSGEFTIDMPSRPYMAVRLVKVK